MLANVKGWQTDLKTGLIVPGSVFEDKNTIQNGLTYYLAYKIGTDTTDRALNNLFSADGSPSGHGGEDGIAHHDGSEIDLIFDTTLSVGGNNSVSYIEFYGFIDGSATLDTSLYLGHNMIVTPYQFTTTFATYSINTSVASGRRFHFYWRINIIAAAT
jgi:hypothetical protein